MSRVHALWQMAEPVQQLPENSSIAAKFAFCQQQIFGSGRFCLASDVALKLFYACQGHKIDFVRFKNPALKR